MLGVVVKGGTRAGRRIVREPKRDWLHLCASSPVRGGIVVPAAVKRCPDCGTRRP